VVGELTQQIRYALPGNDGRESLWAQRGNTPLRHAQVGHPAQCDAAGRPRLVSGPADEFGVVVGVAVGEKTRRALRGVHSPCVGLNDRVAAADPEERVGRLESGHW
jgi:hypothetical protein